MNPFPAEIWIQIFDTACLDTGLTAQSLSLVCKTSHELVQQFKYQSLALLRPNELVRFSMHLVSTPVESRSMKHLFIAMESRWVDGSGSRELSASPRRYTDEDELCAYLEAMNPFSKSDKPPTTKSMAPEPHIPNRISLQDRHIQKALFLTLTLASPTLVTLSIHLPFVVRRHLLPVYSFPHLEELTIYGPCGFNPTGSCEGLDGPATIVPSPVPRSYPALKRLHLSQSYTISVPLARELLVQAPRLTHLYLQLRSFTLDKLALALGLQPNANASNSEVTEGRFPSSLRNFYLETDSTPPPPARMRPELESNLKRAEELSMLGGVNIVIGSRGAGKWADIGSALVDWEERINGREGRWGKGIYKSPSKEEQLTRT